MLKFIFHDDGYSDKSKHVAKKNYRILIVTECLCFPCNVNLRSYQDTLNHLAPELFFFNFRTSCI